MNYNALSLVILYVGCFAFVVLAMLAQFNAELSVIKAETARLNREVWLFLGIATACLALAIYLLEK
jgi:hypothetical protein